MDTATPKPKCRTGSLCIYWNYADRISRLVVHKGHTGGSVGEYLNVRMEPKLNCGGYGWEYHLHEVGFGELQWTVIAKRFIELLSEKQIYNRNCDWDTEDYVLQDCEGNKKLVFRKYRFPGEWCVMLNGDVLFKTKPNTWLMEALEELASGLEAKIEV